MNARIPQVREREENEMIKLASIGKLGIVACALLTSTAAMATDTKNYSGATCHALSGGTYANYYGTVLNNSSASELNVICPFVKDAGAITGGTVWVYDRNTSYSVSCSIISEYNDASGLFYYFATADSGVGFSSSAIKAVTFGAISDADYTYATCSVPRTSAGNASHIAGFSITET